MWEAFKVINTILYWSFPFFYFILFYFSLKRCFLREGQSKKKLFFYSLFTNPFTLYYACFIVVSAIGAIILYMNVGEEAATEMINDAVVDSALNLLAWVISLLLLFRFARRLAKRLNVAGSSFVTFVYLTFDIILICLLRASQELDSEVGTQVAKLLDSVISFAAVWIFYHFDVKALAKLTNKECEVDWRLFVVPPTVFSILYSVILGLTVDQFNVRAMVANYTLSSALFLLFTWAFYVIIQNLYTTNQAVAAKDQVKALSVEVMEALAHTIDAKDEYTKGHSVRVAKYSQRLAERMGLSGEDCESIYYMGLLHDLGKIGVPNEIINSLTKLSDEEYEVIKRHPGLGYEILAEIKSRPDLTIGARWHHERYDGKGYPDGKAGEEIPLFARIIAVADSYDAMTSNRSYRNYLPQDVVRSEIEKNMGTQFDPEVVKVMLEIMDQDVNYEMHE